MINGHKKRGVRFFCKYYRILLIIMETFLFIGLNFGLRSQLLKIKLTYWRINAQPKPLDLLEILQLA